MKPALDSEQEIADWPGDGRCRATIVGHRADLRLGEHRTDVRSNNRNPETTRFARRQGKLQVLFRPERRGVAKQVEPNSRMRTNGSLAQQLVDRGVARRTAERLADQLPEESERQIELYDRRISSGWRPRGNAGGYLKEAIERKFSGPPGFETSRERSGRRAAASQREAAIRETAKQHQKEAEQGRRAHLNRLDAVEQWKASMSEEAWTRTEAAIVSKLDASQVARYRISRHEQTRVLFSHLQSQSNRIERPTD